MGVKIKVHRKVKVIPSGSLYFSGGFVFKYQNLIILIRRIVDEIKLYFTTENHFLR